MARNMNPDIQHKQGPPDFKLNVQEVESNGTSDLSALYPALNVLGCSRNFS